MSAAALIVKMPGVAHLKRMNSMKVVDRKLSELVPAEYNARYISDEQLGHLKASIQRFEAVEPVLVNMHPDRKNIIISGHQRIKAAKSLGMTEFPCVELNLDRDKERELNIRMNKNTGGWDWDELANHFDTEELTEWGFTEKELFDYNPDEFSEEFDLPDGDKDPFQKVSFILSDEQAESVKNAIAEAKGKEEYKYVETFGNENQNANALYFIIQQWAGSKTYD